MVWSHPTPRLRGSPFQSKSGLTTPRRPRSHLGDGRPSFRRDASTVGKVAYHVRVSPVYEDTLVVRRRWFHEEVHLKRTFCFASHHDAARIGLMGDDRAAQSSHGAGYLLVGGISAHGGRKGGSSTIIGDGHSQRWEPRGRHGALRQASPF